MAAEALPNKAKEMEMSDQGGEKQEEGFHGKEEKKHELPAFFPSHGLTTEGNIHVQYLQVMTDSRSALLAYLSPCCQSTEADNLRQEHGLNELEEKPISKWKTYLHMVSSDVVH